jgi:DMSO/TMAO reductase YedYZ molybdopterin-dependent catalytic subunit
MDRGPNEVDAVDPRLAGLAGVVAAAVALGVGELVSSLGRVRQSLVVSVGDSVIDLAPGSVTSFGIDTFGTADKPVLLVVIVGLALAIGVRTGRAATTRPLVAVAVFGLFGVLGVWAGFDDPLASGGLAVVAALAGVACGLGTLFLLLAVLRGRIRRAPPPVGAPVEYPTDPSSTRRAFFGWSAGLGTFAALAAVGGRALRGPSVAELAREEVVLAGVPGGGAPTGTDLASEVPGLSPVVTPNDDFYRIDTALIVPQVDPASWSLEVTGMVDEPYALSYDELLELSTVEETVTMACVSNEVGGDLVGNAVWQGVPLAGVLDRAGVRPEATQIVGRSVDGFTAGFPTEVAYDGRPALLVVGMNGEPLPVIHGFPARLVVSGLYGYVSATKWLSQIELTTWEGFDGYWMPRGWSKRGPVKTQARIDVPRRGQSLTAGHVPVAGVAWAPDRGIQGVEVQVDDDAWVEAELGESIGDDTWRQWVATWDATPGVHQLRVRARDGTGEVQTRDRSRPDPDGATGWHTIEVDIAE